MGMNLVKKTVSYIKRYGVKELFQKANEKINSRDDYNETRLDEIAGYKELEGQKSYKWDETPLISIVMPVYNTPQRSIIQTLISVMEQTYTNWELCIADGGTNKLEGVIKDTMKDDGRLKYMPLKENLGISGNSNAALMAASGDYVAFLDHDDILEPNALFEIAQCIVNNHSGLIYTDEDKVTEGLDNYFAPYRKSDYNKALLLSNNYICHFTAIKRTIIHSVGGFRQEYDGAQDYDMILRCVEKCDRIDHIDKILYHWRVGANSTSDNPFNKEYAFNAGKRAIEAYLERNGYEKVIVKELSDPGYFKLVNTSVEKLSVKKVYRDYYETAEELFEMEGGDYSYYLLLKPGMLIKKHCINNMLSMASIYNADIVAPKIISSGRYMYNGIAKAGKGHTQLLKGRPAWYRGRFNLGITSMNVNYCPRYGILVKKENLAKVMDNTGKYITNRKGTCNNMTMIYSPDSVIEI